MMPEPNPPGGKNAPPPPGPHGNSFNASVIAGGVVGAIVALALAGIAFWLYRRRLLRRQNARSFEDNLERAGGGREVPRLVVEPFLGAQEPRDSEVYQLYTPLQQASQSSLSISAGMTPIAVSKLDRYLDTSRTVTPATSPSSTEPTLVGTDNSRESARSASRGGQAESGEIPWLVQRLNGLLQASGRRPVVAPVDQTSLDDEAPPQYEREARPHP